MYGRIFKKELKLCPGGVCEDHPREAIQNTNPYQLLILVIAIGIFLISFVNTAFNRAKESPTPTTQTETEVDEDCIVPDWAIEIGHEEMWKLHQGCE